MLSQHPESTRLSDKEKKDLARPFLQFTQRSYAEERGHSSHTASSSGVAGGSRAAASGNGEVRFAWPPGITLADVSSSRNEQSTDDRDAYIRYVDRDILSDHDDEGAETMRAGEDLKQQEGDAEAGAGANGDSDADVDGHPHTQQQSLAQECVGELDPRLRSLTLDVTVATAGRQQGMRCCLDALHAVLSVLVKDSGGGCNAVPALRQAVGRLTGVDIENLERMRTDLDNESDGDKCDWEPLERVLSLRPLFFRLLRSAVGGGIRQKGIGPRTGGGSEDPSEVSWRTWLLSAQGAVAALGEEEQHRLQVYVNLCIRRRAALSSGGINDPSEDVSMAQYPALGGGGGGGGQSGGAPVGPLPTSQWDAKQLDRTTSDQFPSLDGGGGSSSGTAQAAEGPGAGWGRPRQQPPPIPKRSSGPLRAIATGWDDGDAEAEEAFPSLGGSTGVALHASSSSSSSRPGPKRQQDNSSWGSGSKKAAESAVEAAPARATGHSAQQPKAQAPARAKGAAPIGFHGGVKEFPTLGGSGGGAGAVSWAAQAREREAATAVAAPPPKALEPKAERRNFETATDDVFPELPSSGPTAAPRMSAAAQAGAKAGMLAKSKAKAKAKAAQALPASTASDSKPAGVEHVEDDNHRNSGEEETLVMIHNPLDAVALSEAANSSRKNKKVGPKPGGATKGSVANPWGKAGAR